MGHGWRNEHEADGDHRRRQGWGTAAATLRDEGFGGPVVIISRGTRHPDLAVPRYPRHTCGRKRISESWYVKPADWYAAHGVELLAKTAVTAS